MLCSPRLLSVIGHPPASRDQILALDSQQPQTFPITHAGLSASFPDTMDKQIGCLILLFRYEEEL